MSAPCSLAQVADLGVPRGYLPAVARTLKSVPAAILYHYLSFWSGKSPDGWSYHSAAEIEEDLALSYEEQKTARRALRTAGVLTERHDRLAHRMYFRIDVEAASQVGLVFSRTRVSRVRERGFATVGNEGLPQSLSEAVETSVETSVVKTPRGKRAASPKKEPDPRHYAIVTGWHALWMQTLGAPPRITPPEVGALAHALSSEPDLDSSTVLARAHALLTDEDPFAKGNRTLRYLLSAEGWNRYAYATAEPPPDPLRMVWDGQRWDYPASVPR